MSSVSTRDGSNLQSPRDGSWSSDDGAPSVNVQFVDAKFQITDKAKKFVEIMDGWCSKKDDVPAYNALLNAGSCLSEWGQDLFGKAEYESKVAIVGDESSGKTTFATRLLETVTMVMDEKTATKCRTRVSATFVPDQKETACDFNYEPKGIAMTNLSVPDLFKLHISTFEKEEVSANLCEIRINLAKPTAGIGIIDHPGFVARRQQETQQCFEDTMQELYGGPKVAKYASVVLVHAVNARPEGAHYVKFPEIFARIPQGRLYVAVTKADRMNLGEVFQQRIRGSERVKHKKNKDGKIECTAWDIMQILIDVIKKPVDDEAPKLPDHAQVFFVCGYSGDNEDLTKPNAWEHFDANCRNNEKKMRQMFITPQKWEDDLILKDMSAEEEKQFDAHLGFEKLQNQICGSQADCWRDVISSLMRRGTSGSISSRVSELESRLVDAKHRRDNSPDPSTLILDFANVFNRFYCNTAGPAAPYFPAETNGREQQIWRDIHATYQGMTTPPMTQDDDGRLMQMKDSRSTLGYTLHEERDAFAKLKKQGIFPPPSRSLAAVKGRQAEAEFMEALKKDLVHNADRRLFSLPTLLLRFQSEYAVLSQAVATPEVTADMVVAKQKTFPGSMTGNISEAISSHIADEYRLIYLDRQSGGSENVAKADAGNIFVATRVALCHALHGQSVLDTLTSIKYFHPLFRDGLNSNPTDIDILSVLESLSRFQNELHEANAFSKEVAELKHDKFCLATLINDARGCPDGIWTTLEDQAQGDPYSGIEDVLQVIVAHYFDSVYRDLLDQLDARTMKISRCMPAYFAASMHFDSCFVHQNSKFLQMFAKFRPQDYWTRAFHSSDDGHHEGDLKNEESGSPFHSGDDGKLQDEKEPFARIKDMNTVKQVGACGNQLGETTALDRAYLMANLIDMMTGPDVVVPPQSSGQLDPFVTSSMNYVIQRNVSAAVKSTMDDVVLNIAATGYRFAHPMAMDNEAVLIKQRLLSVCLGYNYPYLQKEQPRKFRHLSLDNVVPFLYRWKDKLLGNADEELDGTVLETRIYQSHLFQAVCSKVYTYDQGKLILDEQGKTDMNAKIEVWYKKWVQADEESETLKNAEQDLHKDILTFLLGCRYAPSSTDRATELEVEQLNRLITDWKRLGGYLKSFDQFVNAHADDLLGRNGEDAKTSKSSVRPQKPPPQEVNISVQDPGDKPSSRTRATNFRKQKGR